MAPPSSPLPRALPATDDATCGGPYGSVVSSLGSDVGAGGAFEGTGGFAQFLASGRWGGLGDGVEQLAHADELRCGAFLVVSAKHGCCLLDDMGRFATGVGWARRWFARLTGVVALVVERSGVEA